MLTCDLGGTTTCSSCRIHLCPAWTSSKSVHRNVLFQLVGPAPRCQIDPRMSPSGMFHSPAGSIITFFFPYCHLLCLSSAQMFNPISSFCSVRHKDRQDLGFPSPLSSPHWLFSVKSLQAENATGPFLHPVCLSSLTPSVFLCGSGDPTDTCNIGIKCQTMMLLSSHGNIHILLIYRNCKW